jgi:hypothetical protein
MIKAVDGHLGRSWRSRVTGIHPLIFLLGEKIFAMFRPCYRAIGSGYRKWLLETAIRNGYWKWLLEMAKEPEVFAQIPQVQRLQDLPPLRPLQ